jgi:aldose 1-epimerase
MIELTHGDWRLGLLPELGGAVSHLTFAGRNVLRPTPANPADVLQTASFPLVPFANRIADGRFTFAGREVNLASSLDGGPHALHGQGWRGAWTVDALGEAEATLGFSHPAGAWPWTYRASQVLRLTDAGLTVSLSVVNLSDEAAPMGLGFHPYFAGKAQASLQAHLTGVWLADEQSLATRRVDGLPFADWAAGASPNIPGLVDHCHTGWDGVARIRLAASDLAVTMTASPDLRWLHIFAPPGEDHFCVEPVSHRPNVVNAADPVADGVRILAPGERWTVSMTLSAERLSGGGQA